MYVHEKDPTRTKFHYNIYFFSISILFSITIDYDTIFFFQLKSRQNPGRGKRDKGMESSHYFSVKLYELP